MTAKLKCPHCNELIFKRELKAHHEQHQTWPDDFFDKDAAVHDKQAADDWQKQCEDFWRNAERGLR